LGDFDIGGQDLDYMKEWHKGNREEDVSEN